jgi:hypothetical protein
VGLRCSGNAHNTCRKPRSTERNAHLDRHVRPALRKRWLQELSIDAAARLIAPLRAKGPWGCHSAAPRNAPARRVPRKTPASIRDIPLAPQLAALLLRHRLASRVSGEHVFASSVGTPLGHRTPSSAASPMPRNAHASLGPTSRATLDGGMLQRAERRGLPRPGRA